MIKKSKTSSPIWLKVRFWFACVSNILFVQFLWQLVWMLFTIVVPQNIVEGLYFNFSMLPYGVLESVFILTVWLHIGLIMFNLDSVFS